MNAKKQEYSNKLNRLLLWLGALEGVTATIALLSLPSETGKFFGLSPARLAILCLILIPCAACLILAITSPVRLEKAKNLKLFKQEPFLTAGFFGLLSILIATIPALFQDLYASTNTYAYLAYSQRILPLTAYAAILLFQILIWILLNNQENLKSTLSQDSSFLKIWGLSYAGVVVLVALIAVTRFGLNRDRFGWGQPTVPLMEWQIWLGIILLVIFRLGDQTLFFQKVSSWIKRHTLLSGWLASLAIWLLAFGLWSSLPVPPGFFATPPRAPNFEIYPFSDAAFYDFHAQSMLIGLGFRGDSIPPRPLYILFLAFAHLVMGQEYSRVILLQTAILAFLPVIIYWIGKKLSNSQIGLVAALFVICREWTSIVCTPFTSDVSNSKLLFADIPAALVISLVLLFSVIWLQNPRSIKSALLTGGLLGISLLIRTQIIILLPVLLIFFWIVSIQQKIQIRPVLISSILCLVGFGLAVAPWMLRSYRITGQLVLDHPDSQTRLMVLRYYPDVEPAEFDRKPGETTGDYNRRLSDSIREKVMTSPLEPVNFIAAHLLNSEIDNLQVFPVRFSITSPQELIWPQHAFWEEWQGNATPWQAGVMLINLAVLTAGIIVLIRQNSWVGLLPIIVNIAYHFSNSAARNSGWRYILPVDWIFFLLFTAGVYAIINLGRQPEATFEENPVVNESSPSIISLALLAAGILCIGLLPLAGETSFQKLYPKATARTTGLDIVKASANLPEETQSGIRKLITDPNVIIIDGRMLYPRFYGENEGEEKTGKTGYIPLPYARYVFLVAGDPEGTIIFPQDNGELPLRNAQDVILAGCMDGLAVKANIVINPSSGDVYTANPAIPWTCPTQP
jgi:hypothetical protein